MMGGVVQTLRSGTLYKNFNGIMTESGYRNFLGAYKEQNPDATQVFHFCAGNVQDIITNFGINKIQLSPESSKYGLDIMQYKARGLTSHIVACPVLDASPTTKGWGAILDMDRIRMRSITKDTFYPWDRNRGAGGEIMYDTYLGVYSLQVANESRHAFHVGALV
jgi:hypothetical protein